MIIARVGHQTKRIFRFVTTNSTSSLSSTSETGKMDFYRYSTYFRSGAIKPKPEEMPFGLLGLICAVVPGLFIGAAISKSVANFLEENDLFVPSEDDDED